MDAQDIIAAMTSLRTGRVGEHEKPHKPALLLAILTLADQGQLKQNRVSYGPELFALFRRYLDAVRTKADATNMLDPFWRLRTDGLLVPIARSGYEQVISAGSTPPSVSKLQEMTDGSKLEEAFFQLASDPAHRAHLRELVVSRYFADRRSEIENIATEEKNIGECERQLEEKGDVAAIAAAPEPVREQAFRRVVLRAYDYRCAACGLRVIVDDLALVEAAHLIPFNETRDDDPRNGIALCKNHHWALDRFLIAPNPEAPPRWSVSRCLDDRIEGQREMIQLDGRSIIMPRELKWQPRTDAMAWRRKRLLQS